MMNPVRLFIVGAALCAGYPGVLAGQPGETAGRTGEARAVAVTFDDLPANTPRGAAAHGEILDAIAATLAARGVPSIGFVNEGKLYEGGGDTPRPERVALLERWLDAGLELGNHGHAHLDLHHVSLGEWLADAARGEHVTRALLGARGAELRWFRHPFLRTGRDLATRDSATAFLAARGVRVAPVTIDNQEWIFARAYERGIVCGDPALRASIAEAYLAYMESMFEYYEAQSRLLLGREIPQVLLLHANALNADNLGPLLDRIEGRGYRFVPLEEAVQDPVFGREDRYAGPGGITWIHRWAITAGRPGSDFRGEPDVPSWVEGAYRAAVGSVPCAASGPAAGAPRDALAQRFGSPRRTSALSCLRDGRAMNGRGAGGPGGGSQRGSGRTDLWFAADPLD